jgi:hypothetical protein
MPSWSPPRTLSPKNQKLEWQQDPRPPGKCQVNSDKREARASTELAYPLETAPGAAKSTETGHLARGSRPARVPTPTSARPTTTPSPGPNFATPAATSSPASSTCKQKLEPGRRRRPPHPRRRSPHRPPRHASGMKAALPECRARHDALVLGTDYETVRCPQFVRRWSYSWGAPGWRYRPLASGFGAVELIRRCDQTGMVKTCRRHSAVYKEGPWPCSSISGGRRCCLGPVSPTWRTADDEEPDVDGPHVRELMAHPGRNLEAVACTESPCVRARAHFRLATDYIEELARVPVLVHGLGALRRDRLLDHREVRPVDQPPAVSARTPRVVVHRAGADNVKKSVFP